MDITVSDREDGTVVVDVDGAVDVYTAAQLRAALDVLIGRGRTRMILDFDGVDFLDSTGLGVLVARLKVVRVQDGWLRLVCTSEKILRVLRITGLDNLFPIHATVDEAAHNPSASGNTAAAG
ncbi:MAG: STAS domain-containing protein [Tetrasphaera sp.]|nr:STAS domain-containing protein [Tetrasphaera sp.]